MISPATYMHANNAASTDKQALGGNMCLKSLLYLDKNPSYTKG